LEKSSRIQIPASWIQGLKSTGSRTRIRNTAYLNNAFSEVFINIKYSQLSNHYYQSSGSGWFSFFHPPPNVVGIIGVVVSLQHSLLLLLECNSSSLLFSCSCRIAIALLKFFNCSF
jgi:hypothetical protein